MKDLEKGRNGRSFAANVPSFDFDGEVDFTKSTEIFALPQTQSNPNAVVATVNGREIWSGQFQRVLNMRAAELRPRMSPEQLQEVAPRIASDVLNEIIRQYLLESDTEAAPFSPTS